MARLEDLKRGALVEGVIPSATVEVVDIKWHGSTSVELTFKDAEGRPDNRLIYRDDEPTLTVTSPGRAWSFDADGDLLKLASEAHRIRLAHLFDPVLAVHISMVEPLPHQITAVYEEMLTRQPLRFLLADDPGAGKTIMAGLLIKELMIRGDLRRCLIVAPGSLVEQWQDEMHEKFQIPFEVYTKDRLEASRTGNPFAEIDLLVVRLDQLSRNDDLQELLGQTDWDLVVCDEAHKMSASFFGGEVRETKRHQLGRLLTTLTRHFLLLTATPHNGKEEDFQLFMRLIDGDRFEGRFREGVHTANIADLMRRLSKERLLRFDGRPLFPERRAYTVGYKLTEPEAALYKEVTDYVREEMNRADRLVAEGEGRRGNMVGFALTILQRRLASSPEAIYQSIRRRRERLEARLREEKLLERGAIALSHEAEGLGDVPDVDDIDEFEEDNLDEEVQETQDRVVDLATAARTVAELELEIKSLERLELAARRVRNLGTDTKWDELSNLLSGEREMFDAKGGRRKMVIFSEHRDTLNYVANKIRTLIGRDEAVVEIHGGVARADRRRRQEEFTNNPDVMILVATDAAGEGINLQRAHLMVNYDLPWNPNRIEQRFGRIHRIGQEEVCHLWNLVAHETREGDVYSRLLEKLKQESETLGGDVFNVLGKLSFEGKSLRQLLMEAVRYGDRPEIRARLEQVVDDSLDHDRLVDLMEEKALAKDTMDTQKVMRVREEMERAGARKLQPHYIRSFFLEAFRRLGGTARQREPGRYEISHVPALVRSRDRVVGTRQPVSTRYQRISFEKDLIRQSGKPLAEFVCPGHPLLDATVDLVIERYRDTLRRGAVLVDETDAGEELRVLFYLEHSIRDGRRNRDGTQRVISRRLEFVEFGKEGDRRIAGYAPYLNYRSLDSDKDSGAQPALEDEWLSSDLEAEAISFAVERIVPDHLREVRQRVEDRVDRTLAAVKDRLTKEINYWDHRAEELRLLEEAGRHNTRINSGRARRRADDLQTRLRARLEELDAERQISAAPPIIVGGAIVVPAGILASLTGQTEPGKRPSAAARRQVELRAMEAVMAAERGLGWVPKDVSADDLGYDVESSRPAEGKLRFIEVKGRASDARTVTLTKNEILVGLNKPDSFILALVLVDGEDTDGPHYVREPFETEPDFGVTSVNYDLDRLLSRAEVPG